MMMQEASIPISITPSPAACISSTNHQNDKQIQSPEPLPPPPPPRSPQSLSMSVYRTRIANQPHLVTITWCKNLLLHGLSISVDSGSSSGNYHCKIELKPWYFWRKQGSKHFTVDSQPVDVVWDLKSAKFNGEVEPQSDYYVAIVSGEEVVLAMGDLKKEAFRRTGCRPALDDPVLVSKREHLFGKKRVSTRVKLKERGKAHEISVECKSGEVEVGGGDGFGGATEMDVRVDGETVLRVERVQWKFRGNVWIEVDEIKVEVCWDLHDWIFGSGPRHALFLFKPMPNLTDKISVQPPSSSCGNPSSFLCPEGNGGSMFLTSIQKTKKDGFHDDHGLPEFCLFLYAWKVE